MLSQIKIFKYGIFIPFCLFEEKKIQNCC